MTHIAVACMEDGRISRHFGRSTHFQIFSVADGVIRGITTARVAPVLTTLGREGRHGRHNDGAHGEHHGERRGEHHGHTRLLGALDGCSVALARGMGTGVAGSLARANIVPVVADGDYTPEEAVQAYLRGGLKTKEPHACHEHGRKHKEH